MKPVLNENRLRVDEKRQENSTKHQKFMKTSSGKRNNYNISQQSCGFSYRLNLPVVNEF